MSDRNSNHDLDRDLDRTHGQVKTDDARPAPAAPAAPAATERQGGQAIGRGFIETDMAGSETHRRAAFSDPIPPGDPDGVAGEGPIPGREE